MKSHLEYAFQVFSSFLFSHKLNGRFFIYLLIIKSFCNIQSDHNEHLFQIDMINVVSDGLN